VIAATATWVHPVPEGLLEVLGDAELVVTVEDGLTDAGVGEAWAEFARLAGREGHWSHHGVPREFIEHASRAQVLEQVGLEASVIADAAVSRLG
jgi:1-deoxy-D-xylulose-5-phosphate synthase